MQLTKSSIGLFLIIASSDRAGVYYPRSEAEWDHTVRGI